MLNRFFDWVGTTGNVLRVGSKYTWHSVCKMSSLFGTSGSAKKLVHVLFAKCPAFGTFSNRLSEVIFERSLADRLCQVIFERSLNINN